MAWLAGLISAGASYQASHEQNRRADAALKSANQLNAAQLELGRDQLDYLMAQDEYRSGLGSAWYDNQRDIAEQEDARRFAILPQMYDNAQALFDERMANAGLFYDEATGLAYDAAGNMMGNAHDLFDSINENAQMYGGNALDNAYGYQDDIVGNADRMYDELTGNARYSDADIQAAVDVASGDVAQNYDRATGMARRNMLRYGGNPNSSDFARFESNSALDEALAQVMAQNDTRRKMRADERDRMERAIQAGLGARGSALQSGYGAVDSANRYAGDINERAINTGHGAIDSALRGGTALQMSAVGSGRAALDNAITSGRGALDDAMRTNLATSSAQLGLVDPRIGIVSQTGPGYSATAAALGQQAANNTAAANQHSENATNAMIAAGKTAGTIAGYYYRPNQQQQAQQQAIQPTSYDTNTGMSSYGDNQEY
jgi:hypothetical protein